MSTANPPQVRSLLFFNAVAALSVLCAALLSMTAPLGLLLLVCLATLALLACFLSEGRRSLSFDRWSGFLKAMCALPLGLGAVVGFGLLSSEARERELERFTIYINVAVVGNIAMMVGVPTGGAWRGATSRLACAALVVWLLWEMAAVEWKTVRYENGAFLFIASPMPWVLSHALYRAVLVTLPDFESLRYLLLEIMSLSLMVFFHQFFGKKNGHPIAFYFGYSDTLVVSVSTTCSKLFDYLVASPDGAKMSAESFISRRTLDAFLVPVHIIVMAIAVQAILQDTKVEMP